MRFTKRFYSIMFFIIIVVLLGSMINTYSRTDEDHLHLKSEKKELFWFNGIHCNDPNHRMFNDIRKEFSSFKPDLVLVEGGANTLEAKNAKEAILSGGEPGFASYLAKDENITVENIEPRNSDVYKYLLNKYEKNDVMAMFILRQLNQKQMESDNLEVIFNQYFLSYINKMIEDGFTVDKREVNLYYISEILEPHIGFKINNSNWKEAKAKNIVYSDDGIIHNIWKDTIDFRNNHVVQLIDNKLQDYNRIFIMMGFDHAEEKEKEIREVFDSYK